MTRLATTCRLDAYASEEFEELARTAEVLTLTLTLTLTLALTLTPTLSLNLTLILILPLPLTLGGTYCQMTDFDLVQLEVISDDSPLGPSGLLSRVLSLPR